MKNATRDLTLAVANMNSQKVRIVMFVITLTMFVLAAGAPECGGGIVR